MAEKEVTCFHNPAATPFGVILVGLISMAMVMRKTMK
jgi:hypothetical protein